MVKEGDDDSLRREEDLFLSDAHNMQPALLSSLLPSSELSCLPSFQHRTGEEEPERELMAAFVSPSYDDETSSEDEREERGESWVSFSSRSPSTTTTTTTHNIIAERKAASESERDKGAWVGVTGSDTYRTCVQVEVLCIKDIEIRFLCHLDRRNLLRIEETLLLNCLFSYVEGIFLYSTVDTFNISRN